MDLTAEEFLKKLDKCITHYRKMQVETADDIDLAHFFDPKLKKFLLDNKSIINTLFGMKSLLPFQKFVTGYIWKGK